jgi:hypothetical protein
MEIGFNRRSYSTTDVGTTGLRTTISYSVMEVYEGQKSSLVCWAVSACKAAHSHRHPASTYVQYDVCPLNITGLYRFGGHRNRCSCWV